MFAKQQQLFKSFFIQMKYKKVSKQQYLMIGLIIRLIEYNNKLFKQLFDNNSYTF